MFSKTTRLQMLLVWASIPERPVSPGKSPAFHMIPGGEASNRFRFNIADVHRRLIILKMRVPQAFVVFAEQQYPKGTLVPEL